MRLLLSEERVRQMIRLYPGKSKNEVERILYKELKKKMCGAVFVAGVLFVLALILTWKEHRGQEAQNVIRPEYGAANLVQKVQIERSDGWLETELIVSATELTEEQIVHLHEESEEYLDLVVLAENESFQRIEGDLCFPEEVSGGYAVSWSTDALWLVDAKGQVHNGKLKEERNVTITAQVDYGTEFRIYERRVVVWPKVYTQEEQELLVVQQELVRLEAESRNGKAFLLPSAINGRRIKLSKDRVLSAGVFLGVLSVLVPLFVYYGYFNNLEKRKKLQAEQATNGYTEFVTKLSLLLVAGSSVREAFGRLAKEYANTYGDGYILTKELKVTCRELANGCPETVAYEEFGDRFGLVPYRRMASLLVQNSTKGVQNIRRLLLEEAKEVMAEERTKIKIRGEQAGTKLLLPMMGFLVLIFAILLVPAFGMF